MFEKEAIFLKKSFPSVIGRIEHFGSTSVPGLSAKPIIDILVEVKTYRETKKLIVPKLTSLGYEYFWRPEFDKPPMYAWFIKRNKKGKRTHHIHMVRKDSKFWERIYFRDYLRKHPKIAKKYADLKINLARKYSNDRINYTRKKTDFITAVTKKALGK
ncbi:MAG: GrpB family protein [Patescibacteria group bacterium]